jgi:hypothetical protein
LRHAGRGEDHVGPRLDRPHRRFAAAVHVRDRAHGERIREQQPVEAEVLAQETGQELGRERRRRRAHAEDAGNLDVRGHDRVDAAVDRAHEGYELRLHQAVTIRGYHWEAEV